MTTAAQQTLDDWCQQLAARQATPGGGGAAALSTAIACAVGAMSAHYTTGKKWTDRSEIVEPLIAQLDQARSQALAWIDADAAAYQALQASWKDDSLSAEQKKVIEAQAAAIPAGLLQSACEWAEALVAFLPHCNPMIISDAQVAIHLLAGAGRAAWRTRCCGAMTTEQQACYHNYIQRLDAAERSIDQ